MVGLVAGLFGCSWVYCHDIFITSTSVVVIPINFLYVLIQLPVFLVLTVINPPMYLDAVCTYGGTFFEWFLIGYVAAWIYYRRAAKT